MKVLLECLLHLWRCLLQLSTRPLASPSFLHFRQRHSSTLYSFLACACCANRQVQEKRSTLEADHEAASADLLRMRAEHETLSHRNVLLESLLVVRDEEQSVLESAKVLACLPGFFFPSLHTALSFAHCGPGSLTTGATMPSSRLQRLSCSCLLGAPERCAGLHSKQQIVEQLATSGH